MSEGHACTHRDTYSCLTTAGKKKKAVGAIFIVLSTAVTYREGEREREEREAASLGTSIPVLQSTVYISSHRCRGWRYEILDAPENGSAITVATVKAAPLAKH